MRRPCYAGDNSAVAHYKRVILFAFSLALACAVAYYVRGSLLLIYVSIVFAVVLSPAVDRVHRLRLWRWSPGRGAAMMLIVAGLVSLAALFLIFVLPPIIDDIQEFGRSLPGHLRHLNARIKIASLRRPHQLRNDRRSGGQDCGRRSGRGQPCRPGLVAAATVVILTAYLILDGKPRVRVEHVAVAGRGPRAARRGAGAGGAAHAEMAGGQALLMLVLGRSSALVFGLLGNTLLLRAGGVRRRGQRGAAARAHRHGDSGERGGGDRFVRQGAGRVDFLTSCTSRWRMHS